MTDFLIQLALGNLLISGVLAAMAYAVHRRRRHPGLAHLLWVIVLIKLVTPPLLTLPIVALPGSPIAEQPGSGSAGAIASVPAQEAVLASSIEAVATTLLLIWVVGAVLVLAASLLRIFRFDRLLRRTCREAPAEIQWAALDMARRLGMDSAPTIYASSARLSPMTWWTGGRVRVVIPEALPEEVGAEPLRWVLAHELAHVKRRDYIVRWLEWLACVSFWWNPVAWWARRNLRFDEEASCDALVLDHLGPKTRSYGRALLAVVEFLSGPAVRPPILATGIDARGSLERRFSMIVSNGRVTKTPRWLVVGLVSSALVMMPLGVGNATDSRVDEGALGDVAIEASAEDVSNEAVVTHPSHPDEVENVPRSDDGYALLQAELQDAVAEGESIGTEVPAQRAVQKAKRQARKAMGALKEASRAAERARRQAEKAQRQVKKAQRALDKATRQAKKAIRALEKARRAAEGGEPEELGSGAPGDAEVELDGPLAASPISAGSPRIE